MYIIIAGAGMVGSEVASNLVEKKHDVVIIDEDKEVSLQFFHLGHDIVDGPTTIGLPKKVGHMTVVAMIRATPGRLDTVDRHICFLTKQIDPGGGNALHGAVRGRL